MRKLMILALMSLVLPIKAQVQIAWFNYPGGVSEPLMLQTMFIQLTGIITPGAT